jgi:hypothetical protein
MVMLQQWPVELREYVIAQGPIQRLRACSDESVIHQPRTSGELPIF